jgi:hypothetical protein
MRALPGDNPCRKNQKAKVRKKCALTSLSFLHFSLTALFFAILPAARLFPEKCG